MSASVTILFRRGLPWMCGLAMWAWLGPAQAEPRAVLELFTSQGCSSCPPADKLAGELAKDKSLIVISAPIDYWDYLGWRDTLAVPLNAKRQNAYARLRGDRQVYTPQMVVNGARHTHGGDRNAIEQAIAATSTHADVMKLPVSLKVEDGKLLVSVPAGRAGLQAEVWLCGLKRAVPVEISRGENRGTTVVYHNVVQHWARLGAWDGTAQRFAVPLSAVSLAAADDAAVIVQTGRDGAPGPVYGAAVTALK